MIRACWIRIWKLDKYICTLRYVKITMPNARNQLPHNVKTGSFAKTTWQSRVAQSGTCKNIWKQRFSKLGAAWQVSYLGQNNCWAWAAPGSLKNAFVSLRITNIVETQTFANLWRTNLLKLKDSYGQQHQKQWHLFGVGSKSKKSTQIQIQENVGFGDQSGWLQQLILQPCFILWWSSANRVSQRRRKECFCCIQSLGAPMGQKQRITPKCHRMSLDASKPQSHENCTCSACTCQLRKTAKFVNENVDQPAEASNLQAGRSLMAKPKHHVEIQILPSQHHVL